MSMLPNQKITGKLSLWASVLLCIALAALCFATHAHADIRFDRDQTQAWADEYFGEHLAERRFSGAGITVFQDGEIILARGYGYEDFKKKTPFDPEQTKVRVCSNSKIFVATALMQLFDKGVIKDLSDPANMYLTRIQLPKKAGKEITIRDLFTHRTGFSAAYFGSGTDRAVETPVKPEVLKRLLPKQIVPPGGVSSYANAALAIQGAIIEDQTGMFLGDYLQRNVFGPVGMSHSLYHYQPGAPERMAIPYRFYPDGSVEAEPLIAKHPVYAPSGGVVSTAVDMAKFLMQHADEGRASAAPLLKTETYRAMHRRQVGNHPEMSGLGLQFFTDTHNGEPVASHGCGLPGFTTMFAIYPDSNSGFFISVVAARQQLSLIENLFNSMAPARMTPKDGCCLKNPINASSPYDAFVSEFLGERSEDEKRPVLPEHDRHNLKDYVAGYLPYRTIQGNILSIMNFAFRIPVSIHQEGGLEIGGSGPFLEVGPDFFQNQNNSSQKFAFLRDDAGKVTRLVWNSTGSAYKTSFYSDPGNLQKFLLLLFVAGLTGFIAFWWPKQTSGERIAAILPVVMSMAFIIALMSLFAGFYAKSEIASIQDYVNVGYNGRFYVLALAGNVIFVAIIAMIWFSWRSHAEKFWGSGARGMARRVHYNFITFAGILTAPFFFTFPILGLQVP